MRFHQMLQAALAGVFVVPAVTLTNGDAQGLEQALAQTVRAIESLSGLRTELENDPDALTIDDAVTRVLSVTEEPRHEGPEQDAVLATLRRDLSRLQMVLDTLTARTPAADGTTATATEHAGSEPEPAEVSGAPSAGGAASAPPITTGLDDATRAALLDIQPPVLAPKSGRDTTEAPRRTDEGEEFTADVLRLGHAYYRAGRYAEGLTILSRRPDDVEARYWSGRCLEHLERYDEALEVYAEVLAHPDAGYFADRAKSDHAFLTWKLDFAKRVEERTPATAPARTPAAGEEDRQP